jgi:SAM-dependent methyltransferase
MVRPPFTPADEEAGARESVEDAVLYDFEYRRRRADVNFYRRLAEERRGRADLGAGPVLDLACGSGRILAPLLRDGHTVGAVDRSAAMLSRATWRLSRLSATRRRRALLLRGDMRDLGLAPRFSLVFCAFHSVQHLVDDGDLTRFLAGVRAALLPDGWLAFDLLPPDPAWIHRDPSRRWARTRFRHPGTGQRLVYTTSQRFDADRQALHIQLYYQPVDEAGQPTGEERVVRLCQRQLPPADVSRVLGECGFRVLSTFGGFDGRPLDGKTGEEVQQHIYIARPRPTQTPSPTVKR